MKKGLITNCDENMNKIIIKTKVKTTEQLTRFLEVMEDVEDRFDGKLEVEIEIDSGEELLERW